MGIEYRVTWRRSGWTSGHEASVVCGTWPRVLRLLATVGSDVRRDGSELTPAVWRVDARDVGPWRSVDVSGPEAPSHRRRELPGAPAGLAAYDALEACRVAVLAVLADGEKRSLGAIERALRRSGRGFRRRLLGEAAADLVERGEVVVGPGPRGAKLHRLASPG